MNSLAVIRASDSCKLRIALHDLVKYGHISYAGTPRKLEPILADSILVNVMKSPLKNGCEAAAIVPLMIPARTAIGRLRKIHPPAHVIIVSSKHEIYNELVRCIDMSDTFICNHPIQNLCIRPEYHIMNKYYCIIYSRGEKSAQRLE